MLTTLPLYRPRRVAHRVSHLLTVLFAFIALGAAAQNVWTPRIQITNDEIKGGTDNGAGLIVVVGDNGSVRTSADNGITWIERNVVNGNSNELQGVAYGNGHFVAVGGNGTIVNSSADAQTWTLTNAGIGVVNLYGVTFANNVFVAVASGGTIITSPDGLTWTLRTTGTTALFEDITYGNGRFVAVAQNGVIRTSTNGTTWSAATSGTTESLHGVTFNGLSPGGLFVAVGNGGLLITSPDGLTWTPRTSATTTRLWAVTYGSGPNVDGGARFVAVGDDGTMVTSVNGLTGWTPVNAGTNELLRYAFFVRAGAGNQFIVTGVNGAIRSSVGGLAWIPRTFVLRNRVFGGAYGNGRFVLVGDGEYSFSPNNSPLYASLAMVSTDGINYVPGQPGNYGLLYDVAFGNGVFVATGSSGVLLTSTDGLTWTRRTTNVSAYLSAVTYGNGQFVAVGEDGTALTSPNGFIWTLRSMNTMASFSGVTYGNNLYAAVGEAGAISTSPDGITWTARTSGLTTELLTVAYGSGAFVAGSADGKMRRSVDGVTWTVVLFSTPNQIEDILYANGVFVEVEQGEDAGRINTSPDGITWTNRSTRTGPVTGLTTVTFGNGLFVAAGGAYNLLTAPAVTPTNTAPTVANPIQSPPALTVMQAFAFTVPMNTFTDAETPNQLTYQITGLPPGLSANGLAISGMVTNDNGAPYTITVKATDPDGLSVMTTFLLNVNPVIIGGNTPFTIQGVTLLGCAVVTPATATSPEVRSVTFQPQLAGTFTTPVTQSVVAAMLPTTATGPFTLNVSADAPQLTLTAVDATGKAAPNFTWNWLQACNGNSVNTAPTVVNPLPDRLAGLNLPFNLTLPASTFTDAETPNQLTYQITGLPAGVTSSGLVISGSPTGVTIVPLTITVTATDPGGLAVSTTFKLSVSFIAPPTPTFAISSVVMTGCTLLEAATATSPERRRITFTPQLTGTYSLPVTQSVVAAMLPTTATGPFTLDVSSDAPQLTLVAVDAANKPAPLYNWNWLQACTSNARRSAEDAGQLRVVVLGNPVRGEAVEVEISGAAGALVELEMTTTQGVRVDQQRITRTGVTERHWVKLGRSGGLYVLQVRTAGQRQSVKVMKQ